MQPAPTNTSRKKFLLWGTAVLSSLTVLRIFTRGTNKKKETVKMLTRDGRLVEIDKSLLPPKARKISNQELQQWIKK